MIGETRDLFWGYKVTSTGLVFKPDGTLANQNLTRTGKKNNHPYYMVWIRAPWGYWGKYWVHRCVAWIFCPNPRPDIFDRVDHIDRDGTNNHKNNLRWINHSLNMCNRGAKGATFVKRWDKWRAYFRGNTIGYYKTYEKAHDVYIKTRDLYFSDTYSKLCGESVLKSSPYFAEMSDRSPTRSCSMCSNTQG